VVLVDFCYIHSILLHSLANLFQQTRSLHYLRNCVAPLPTPQVSIRSKQLKLQGEMVLAKLLKQQVEWQSVEKISPFCKIPLKLDWSKWNGAWNTVSRCRI